MIINIANSKFFHPNLGRAIAQMTIWMKGAFTSFSNVLRNTSKNKVWIMAPIENRKSKQDLTGWVSDKKENVSRSTGCDGVTSLMDDLCLTNINAEISSENDSTDSSSLNIFKDAFKDLMEEARIQLIVDMETIIQENRKEIKHLNDENKKEMIDIIRKEIKKT